MHAVRKQRTTVSALCSHGSQARSLAGGVGGRAWIVGRGWGSVWGTSIIGYDNQLIYLGPVNCINTSLPESVSVRVPAAAEVPPNPWLFHCPYD